MKRLVRTLPLLLALLALSGSPAAPENAGPDKSAAPSSPADDYVAWLSKRRISAEKASDSHVAGPTYRLTKVITQKRDYYGNLNYQENIDVMLNGGVLENKQSHAEENEAYIVQNPGAPPGQLTTRPEKLTTTWAVAQSWKVANSSGRAVIEWSDQYDQNGWDGTHPNEKIAQITNRRAAAKISLPYEVAIGDPKPIVISFDFSTSGKCSIPTCDEFYEQKQEFGLTMWGLPWFAMWPYDPKFDMGSKVNAAQFVFDVTLTPQAVDSGVRYGMTISGPGVATMTPETRERFKQWELPESQTLITLQNPPSEYKVEIIGPSSVGGTPVTLVYELQKAPRFWKCEPMKLPDVGGGAGGGDPGSIAEEHRGHAKKIDEILARPLPEKRANESPVDYDSRLRAFLVQREKDVIAEDEEMRQLERRWFEKVTDDYGKIPDAGLKALREALAAEATCLAKATTESLDEMRAHSWRFIEDSDYMRSRALYDRYFKDLQHILALWSNVDKLEMLRLEMLIAEYRRARAEGDAEFNAAALTALQLELKNVYVDEGWVSTLREQAISQDAVDARDCYGEGLKAAKKANERLPWHDEFFKRMGQRAIYGTQYVMAVFNTMWTTFVDSLARLFSSSETLDRFVDTLHEQSDKQIAEIQKKTLDRLAALAVVRRFDAAQTRALGAWLTKDGAAPGNEAKLRSLDENRVFHEATSGGLLRFAACLSDDWDEMIDMEYRIAAKHGRLVLAEMRQTVNLREGREAGGNDPLLKRMLDPMGTWKSACSHMRGNYDSMEDYLAERSGQLDEMEGLRPRLNMLHWDLDFLQKNLPRNYRVHYVLARKNADYMAFLERHRLIMTRKQEEALHAALAKEEDSEERRRLAFKIALLQRLAPQDAQSAMPLILKQQLLDHVAVLDFDGAVAVARELEAADPQGAAGLSTWLANDLAWEHAKEVGINEWVSLGNGGLYTAFFTRYFSPAAVRNAPVSLSNIRAVFASWNGFSGFLQFAWGRVNPFSSLTKGELTPAKLAEVSFQITKAAAEQVEQEAIAKSVLSGYFGVDEKYADFLANTLINMQQVQTDDPGSLLNATTRNLLRKLDAYVPEKIDVPGWRKVMAARGMMREYWTAVEARVELEKAMQQLEDATRGKTWDELQVGGIVKLISAAKLKLRLLLNPLNEESIKAAVDAYDERLAAATGEDRLKAHVELFELLPMSALAKAKKDGVLAKSLELKIDNARREILQNVQTEFLVRYPGLAQYVERFIFTGSGARPDWPEYKRLTSDLDFTIVLKEGTPLDIRAKVKATFDEYFQQQAKFAPEEFDIHCFADERPRLSSSGMTVESLLEMVKDPKAAEALAAEIGRNNESLLRDLADPERYLSTGALRFLHYLNKLGGRVKRADGTQLVDDESYQNELYKDVKFEPWMGLEMVMDNLKMVGAHSGSRLDYSKALAKYGLRVLFARVIQSERGMKLANELTIDQIEANIARTGGIHGEFVRMAEQLGGRFTPDQLRLFREMNLRKQGRPWSEVFEERLGRKVSENDPALNVVIEKHIAEMEGFVKQSLTECATTNATHMKELANAIEAATDPAAKEALTAKYREILYSVATVWNSLGDAERKTVLAAAPAESEMFTALEDIRTSIQKRDLAAIKAYKPFRKRGGTPMDDDK